MKDWRNPFRLFRTGRFRLSIPTHSHSHFSGWSWSLCLVPGPVLAAIRGVFTWGIAKILPLSSRVEKLDHLVPPGSSRRWSPARRWSAFGFICDGPRGEAPSTPREERLTNCPSRAIAKICLGGACWPGREYYHGGSHAPAREESGGPSLILFPPTREELGGPGGLPGK